MRFVAAMMFLLPLCAQTPEQAQAPRPGPQVPQNLKVLKPEEVNRSMRTFTAGLGVRCDFCHVQGDFSSDANGHKAVARRMIAMLQQINASFGDAGERVTCYTCHRGEPEPKNRPAPAQTPGPVSPNNGNF